MSSMFLSGPQRQFKWEIIYGENCISSIWLRLFSHWSLRQSPSSSQVYVWRQEKNDFYRLSDIARNFDNSLFRTHADRCKDWCFGFAWVIFGSLGDCHANRMTLL
jgi:hypothetical protein